MVDVAELVRPRALADDAPLREAGVAPGEYLLVTAHRAGNVDDPQRLRSSSRCCAPCPPRSCCRCIRARARG